MITFIYLKNTRTPSNKNEMMTFIVFYCIAVAYDVGVLVWLFK